MSSIEEVTHAKNGLEPTVLGCSIQVSDCAQVCFLYFTVPNVSRVINCYYVLLVFPVVNND